MIKDADHRLGPMEGSITAKRQNPPRSKELEDLPPDLVIMNHHSAIALLQLPNAISIPPTHTRLLEKLGILVTLLDPLDY